MAAVTSAVRVRVKNTVMVTVTGGKGTTGGTTVSGRGKLSVRATGRGTGAVTGRVTDKGGVTVAVMVTKLVIARRCVGHGNT